MQAADEGSNRAVLGRTIRESKRNVPRLASSLTQTHSSQVHVPYSNAQIAVKMAAARSTCNINCYFTVVVYVVT